jgi:hypothetical protein
MELPGSGEKWKPYQREQPVYKPKLKRRAFLRLFQLKGL